jgi:hypothetical protein
MLPVTDGFLSFGSTGTLCLEKKTRYKNKKIAANNDMTAIPSRMFRA